MENARVELQLRLMEVPPAAAGGEPAASLTEIFAQWSEAEAMVRQAAELKVREAFCAVFHPLRSLTPRTARKVAQRLPALVLNERVIWEPDPSGSFACPGCADAQRKPGKGSEGRDILHAAGLRDPIDVADWPELERGLEAWRADAEAAVRSIAAAMEAYLRNTEGERAAIAGQIAWLRLARDARSEEAGES